MSGATYDRPGPPLLAGIGLTKSFGPTPALVAASLSVWPGEVVAVMGPSGSGKSTLLHCLAGIVQPDGGQVVYDGTDIGRMPDNRRSALRRRDFGFVFQFGQLVPELTCLENVALPLRLGGVRRKEAEQAARGWLGRLEVEDVADKRPGDVSGGQGQRVAVARALVAEPKVVFADEPTGALDSLNGERVMKLLVAAAKDTNTAIVLVTHEARVAARQLAAIQRTGATDSVMVSTSVNVTRSATLIDPSGVGSITVASCAAIRRMEGPLACRDGDVFQQIGFGSAYRPGMKLYTVVPPPASGGAATVYGHWTVPTTIRLLNRSTFLGPGGELLVTPGAFRGVTLPPDAQAWLLVHVRADRADGIEYVRNAVAGHPLRTFVEDVSPTISLNEDQQTFEQVRTGLLIGSLFTLGLAGVSLLVLALEQIRERRRPLAMLSASGVSRVVLARSLLWQVTVPVALGVVAAIATGLILAALVLRITHTNVVLDWGDVGIFSGAAVVLVLLVTVATLPALRNATRLAALRTE
jgi:putative ABC transport system ATP-binding protein